MKQIFAISAVLSISLSAFGAKKCEITAQSTYKTETKSFRNQEIVGDLVTPIGCEYSSRSVVLVLGGSEGGVPTYVARPLAERGLTAFALGYFGVEGEKLPKSIDLIPLDYFEKALTKIKQLRPDSKYFVMGFSKGAEGALAFASFAKPELNGLVLVAGTGTSFEGFSSDQKSTGNSSWTYQDRAIPFSPYAVPDQALVSKMYPHGNGNPPVLKPFYEATLALTTGEQGALPIENVTSPILFFSGEDDQIWNSTAMSERAMNRANAKGFKHSIKHHSYKNVGHFVLFGAYMLPMDPFNLIRFGGTVEGSQIAEPDVWEKITTFFKTAH